MNKKISKKEQIIQIAFQEWGKTVFKNTSISCITDYLHITKPAFYRHFKSKADLIQQMNYQVIHEIIGINESIINNSKLLKTPEETCYNYMKTHITYFAKNYYHFLFYISFVIKDNITKFPEFVESNKKTNQYFNKMFNEKNKNIFIPNPQIRYVYSTIIILLIDQIKNLIDDHTIKGHIPDSSIQSIIDQAFQIIKTGFGTPLIKKTINFRKLEDTLAMSKNELPQINQIFLAIAKVIKKEGLWNTSIKKITDELGMSKSSLYFYFNNKNEMLNNMIFELIHSISEYCFLKLQLFGSFEEKLYANILALSLFFNHNTSIVHVFDWIHMQGFNLHHMKGKLEQIDVLTKLINDGAAQNKIKTEKFQEQYISKFLRIQVVKEVYLSDIIGTEFNVIDLQKLYQYFINGIFI